MEAIKALNRWANARKSVATLYRVAAEYPDLFPHYNEATDEYHIVPQYAPSRAPVLFRNYWDNLNNKLRVQFLVDSSVIDGIKVYAPSRDDLMALGKLEVRVPQQEYRQPFPTVFMLIPDGVFSHIPESRLSRPGFVICRHWPDANTVIISFCNIDENWSFQLLHWGKTSQDDIEDLFNASPLSLNESRTELPADVVESRATIARAALNFCTVATNCHAIKPMGYFNQEYAEKLQSSLKKKNLPDSVRRANAEALRFMPQVYGFDQHVRLFDREDSPHESAGTGQPVKPHWRRGHWARQAHGAGNLQRKLIFRRPVLVNSHRFAGDLSDTRVTITV